MPKQNSPQLMPNQPMERRCTLSHVVLTAIERELERYDWHKRLASRPKTDLGISAATLLEQERRQRENGQA